MSKKLEITVTFYNGDTGDQEEMEFTVDNQAALNAIDNQLNALLNKPSKDAFIQFYRNVLDKNGELYNDLFPLFRRWGHDKLEWEDVMISKPRIRYNDKDLELELTENEEYDFNEQTQIQLVRDQEGPYMYFTY